MSSSVAMDEKYRAAPRVAHRVVAGRVAIVETLGNKLITLNEVGSEVWQRLDGRSVGEIVQALIPVFDVAPDDLTRDVLSFLETLRSKGLIVGAPPDEIG